MRRGPRTCTASRRSARIRRQFRSAPAPRISIACAGVVGVVVGDARAARRRAGRRSAAAAQLLDGGARLARRRSACAPRPGSVVRCRRAAAVPEPARQDEPIHRRSEHQRGRDRHAGPLSDARPRSLFERVELIDRQVVPASSTVRWASAPRRDRRASPRRGRSARGNRSATGSCRRRGPPATAATSPATARTRAPIAFRFDRTPTSVSVIQ